MTAEPPVAIIPEPLRLTRLGTSVRLGDGLKIAAPAEFGQAARFLRAVFEQGAGWEVEILGPGVSGTNMVRLVVDSAVEHAEGYSLSVRDAAVSISAKSPAGAFYGAQTLRQLLPVALWRSAPVSPELFIDLGGVEIDDAPGYSWRGVHLDVSRHFMPKGFILGLIDLIAMHKCNVLHLHLTDDQGWRMPVATYPKLVEVGAWRRESPAGHYRDRASDGRPHGGHYSTDDLREIVAYAAQRFITVLPEIDMPGHMVAAIAAYPQLGNTLDQREVMTTWGISEHVLNLDPETIAFCADVLDEVMDIFPGRYVHVGGDECPVTEWESNPTAQALMRQEGFSEERQLQGWFTAKMAEHLVRRGRVLVGWDEILEGGAPAGSVVMSWRGEGGGIDAAKAGHDVVMAPMQSLYFDWSYADDPREPLAICPAISVADVYAYDPTPEAIPAECRHHVLGAQCELWTEYVPGPEHAEYLYFPRVCAFAEVVWSGGRGAPRAPFPEFEGRLAVHIERLAALGVNYRPLGGPTPGQARIWQRE
jgi:hexosaminidase